MRNSIRWLIFLYLVSIICANLLVKQFGAYGLWFSSFFLIPFDFVVRCIFHEKWSKLELILKLFLLTLIASITTFFINRHSLNIAIASISGFAAAQVGAGIFYQINKEASWFIKVNMSDLLAIVFDSLLFQIIAFGAVEAPVTLGQIVIKFLGGLAWYYILFKKFKIQNKIK